MILVAGEALMDVFGSGSNGAEIRLVARPGGSPMNVAVGLARLSCRTAFLGALSDDAFGRSLRRHLAAENVDLTFAKASARPTPLSFVTAEPDGRVSYAFRNEGAADHDLAGADVPVALPEAVACLALGSYSIALEPTGDSLVALAERERDRRVVSFDPNVRTDLMPEKARWLTRFERLLGATTIMKMSREDIELAFGSQQSASDLAERVLQRGVRLFVVTDGAGPTIGFTASGTVSVGAIPVPVVDTVGAGDAFHAGLLAWLDRHGHLDRRNLSTLGSERVRDAMRFAGRCAAFACTRAGADLPRPADIETMQHEGN